MSLSLPIPALAALLALGTGVPPATPTADAFPPPSYQLAQLIIEQQVVVRVQRIAPPPPVPAPPVLWSEKKGPKCVALSGLAGALILRPDAVDLVSVGGDRVRARLGKACPALDFYTGFYLKPTKDGKICAKRDAVRSRAGRACEIESFRKLVAKH